MQLRVVTTVYVYETLAITENNWGSVDVDTSTTDRIGI